MLRQSGTGNLVKSTALLSWDFEGHDISAFYISKVLGSIESSGEVRNARHVRI